MAFKRSYTYDTTKSDGFDNCDILLQLYPDENFRTIVLREEDFKTLRPWKLCQLLNEAFEAGRKDAQMEIQLALGIR